MNCHACGESLGDNLYCTNCGQRTVQTSSTLVVATCPRCNDPLGLPADTVALAQCRCGFRFRFRTEDNLYGLEPQEREPKGHALAWISLAGIRRETDSSWSVPCPMCQTLLPLLAAGYPWEPGTERYVNCKCGSFRVRLARLVASGGVEPFALIVPVVGFEPLPLKSRLQIYCSECCRQISKPLIMPGATHRNPLATASCDPAVLPHFGEVWTQCSTCGMARDQKRRTSKAKDEIEGCLMLALVIVGGLAIGALMWIRNVSLLGLALIILVILALLKFLFRD